MNALMAGVRGRFIEISGSGVSGFCGYGFLNKYDQEPIEINLIELKVERLIGGG